VKPIGLRARHYQTGQFVDVVVIGDRIESVEPSEGGHADDGWIAPALFDLQINGGLGISFNAQTLKPEDVSRVTHLCHRHGVAQYLPTLVTASFDALAHGFRTLERARSEDAAIAHAIPGYHLEGPYLSPEDGPRGAHPREHIRPPDLDEFQRLQEAAGGRIKLTTLAPEMPGALPLIEAVVRSGVVVALGHTAATGEQIRAAVDAGARLSTHLGNGSHSLIRRHPNYIWEQAAEDRLWASLITDGHHLPRSVVRCLLRCKGLPRIILTSDASSLAGLPAGRYNEWGTELEISPAGRIGVVGTDLLAGAALYTDACVAQVLAWEGLPVPDVLALASDRPRELLGLPVCRLEAGQPADLVLFDDAPAGTRFRVRTTLVAGRPFPSVG
jgi:N-acetylglucosamine-6-phosphate deacetylase